MRTGVYINIEGNYNRVDSFRHYLSRDIIKAHNNTAPEGKIHLVKCAECGCTYFEQNGRYVNEYSCASCIESYTEVWFHEDN